MTSDKLLQRARAPLMRSALFVPGHRDDFFTKGARSGADGLIFDLEDSVPKPMRAEARVKVAAWIARPGAARQVLSVRINALEHDCLDDDLSAAVTRSLTAVQLPKVESPDDVLRLESALVRHEQRLGLPAGHVRIWPLLETAQGVHSAFEIAMCSARVVYMGAGLSPNGDLARSLGVHHTGTFLEALFVRSKVLLDARAAGVPNPIGGLSATIGRIRPTRAQPGL
jgi:citrate lyase subunit beta / citryl-CoA lyase